jgi:ferredoxin-NADP reductase
MKVTFTGASSEASNIKTFRFEKPENYAYIAGQFIELTLPHDNADERGAKHWFTLSSSPTDDYLSITTKFAERGSSFKQTLEALAPGKQVEMSEPMGDFVLPKDASRPLLFVAGGIGITPFHSIMRWLAASDERRDIKFIYGVNNEDEIVFEEAWQKLEIHASVVVGDPSESWGGERGKLSAELIMALGEPSDDALVYVSGPEPMVEALEKSLAKAGLRKDQLVLDFFPNYENTYVG